MTPITTAAFTITQMVAGKPPGVTGVTSVADRAVSLQVKRTMPSEPVKTATVYESLHNIQADSPAAGNIGTIVVGGEDSRIRPYRY